MHSKSAWKPGLSLHVCPMLESVAIIDIVIFIFIITTIAFVVHYIDPDSMLYINIKQIFGV